MGTINRVAGHERPRGILLGSLKKGRVATTYLFSGESGVGKKLMAVEFAKAVVCQSPVEVEKLTDACDNCRLCRKFSASSHPDLKIVLPEKGMIKIEQVREVIDFLSLKPFEASKKVLIIDDADCMNLPASNALLKTLEEPPDECLIILISSVPDMIIDTIRSRCFTIRFSLLNMSDCERVIREKIQDKSEDAVKELIRLSMGRPGVVLREDTLLLIQQAEDIICSLTDGGESIKWKDRFEMENWLNRFLLILRDLMVVKIDGKGDTPLIHPFLRVKLIDISKRINIQDIIKLYSECAGIAGALRLNLNVSVVLNYVSFLIKECYGSNVRG